VGITTWGVVARVLPATAANTATTRINVAKANTLNRILLALPMTDSVTVVIDLPLFFSDSTRAVKSCTAPKRTPPTTSQMIAGTHPQYRHAITGPMIGAAPAIEAKWCPKRIAQCLAGT